VVGILENLSEIHEERENLFSTTSDADHKPSKSSSIS
jgi:hypothetical protein